MSIWQILVTVFAAIGGGGAAIAIAAWLLRTALNAWLARDAEAFKTRLKADADIEIERLKNSLQMTATEHQVRFSRMHEKRADIIEGLYKKLTGVYWTGQRFVMTSENNPTPQQKEAFDKMTDRLAQVFTYIEEHRIFLPRSVCTLLDEHFRQVSRTVHTAGVFGRIENPNDVTAQQSSAAFTKAYQDFETDIPAMRVILETEFRKMLGVESD
jgi:hypothetical protein